MIRAGIVPLTHRFHDWYSTTELSRQLQWDGLILYTDFQAFVPRPLGLGITSVDRQSLIIFPLRQIRVSLSEDEPFVRNVSHVYYINKRFTSGPMSVA